jgi:hypothetical protein
MQTDFRVGLLATGYSLRPSLSSFPSVQGPSANCYSPAYQRYKTSLILLPPRGDDVLFVRSTDAGVPANGSLGFTRGAMVII